MKDYDIIVIGAGSGGLNIASFMNKAGFSVLLIDKSDRNIGGDCLNFGCVPSKALLHAAHTIHGAKKAEAFGLKVSGKIDMKKVQSYVDSKREHIREHENATYFRKRGMDVVLGEASFAGPHSVMVQGKLYSGKKIILATGSRPRYLDIPGIEKAEVHTNETIFELTTLPRRLLVIGGGPIGIELGQAFLRLGSKVTVVQRGPQFLPKEDARVTRVLLEQLKKEGMEFYFETTPKEISAKDEAILTLKGGKQKRVNFDAVLVSIGRELNLEGLELEKAGIQIDEKGKLILDEHLATTNKDILACGDVAGGFQFTHAAELHAQVILSNFFSPLKKKISYDHFSWVTYTDPEIATFGLSEQTLKTRKVSYKTVEHSLADDDRSIVEEKNQGKLLLFVGTDDKLLGGSVVGKHAGELFQELVLANSSGLKTKDLFNKIYPYPTASRANKAAIASLFSGKLTDLNKKVLRFLY